MKKIPSLFVRDWLGDRSRVTREATPETEWVVNGEGIATRKYDGTCCLIKNGLLFRRYDAKHGKKPPEGFVPAQPAPDEVTGHWPGWLLCSSDNPADKWYMQAYSVQLLDGTYELCGPHFQSNPEQLQDDVFIKHGVTVLPDAPRTFDALMQYLADNIMEGIVWHNPDGRMVKIKASDFGIKWPRKPND